MSPLSSKQAKETEAVSGSFVSFLTDTSPSINFMRVPSLLKLIVKAELDAPMHLKRTNGLVNKLYSLEPEFMALKKSPFVDPPLLHLSSRHLAPKDKDAQMHDITDRRIEFALREVHEATSFSLRASCIASSCAHACVVWLEDLLHNPPQDVVRHHQILSKLIKAQACMADATVDAMQFAPRAISAQGTVCCTLWPKNWQADSAAKANLSVIPFVGGQLPVLGESALKDILV
uniref:uncharacterized protein LOC114594478 n=1 Tax=Podarcis muralis TaxID=64176 RepID=UPI00109F9F2D|nr:uncharacterized protein LOC114594478 [Podarcis muralis]